MDEQEKISFEEEIHKVKHGDGYEISVQESFPSQKKDRFLPVSILIAAAMICAAIVFSVFYRPSAPAPAAAGNDLAAAPAAPTVPAADATKLGARDEVLGNVNAPVTIIEYGDYQCPFCTRFFTQTEPSIVKNYVNTGKAKMVFRNFPFLGPESLAAAQAAECAFDQKKLWAYHDALYQSKVDDEAKGGGENDGSFSRALFVSIAQKLGLNMPTFTACIDSNKYANDVAQEKAVAVAAGVNSTPSFFVNTTQILGAQPYVQFQAAIDAALKG